MEKDPMISAPILPTTVFTALILTVVAAVAEVLS